MTLESETPTRPEPVVRAEGDRPPDPSDEELSTRVAQGDAAAFDTLAGRHMERAFRVAYRLAGQREDAEDLVQEAFVRVLERIDTFDPGRSFAPWFYRILTNLALNQRRAGHLRRTQPLPVSVQGSTLSPARQAEQAEVRERLGAALARLPETQQDIVKLFELEGFSGQEIAGMLDLPAGTVRWHLHEARKALRQALNVFEPTRP